jgi:molybdate transport repressor ModE-like protein
MESRSIDWALLQSFLRVARAGSLSAAARASGISQPTLGRHMRALQDRLGKPLLTRTPSGQALTPAGAALLAEAEAMEAAAARIALAAAGASARLEGTVRLTASRMVAHYLLPPLLERLRRQEPGIQIELVASDQPENLLFRQADIALRMFRPESGDLTVQKLADLPLGLYAAKRYLARAGRPRNVEALMKLDFVGYDRSELMLQAMAKNGIAVSRDFFALRCDDQLVHWALVRAGCGVGGMQIGIARADREVERIAPFLALPPLPLWLVVPEALRHVPRIARLRRAIEVHFGPLGRA